MQKLWFRIETDADGAILSCEEVASKGRQGSVVRYYEALDKAEACRLAKEWAERIRAKRRERTSERRAAIMAAGECVYCPASARLTATRGAYCDGCYQKMLESQREKRRSGRQSRAPLSALELKARHIENGRNCNAKARERWGTSGAVQKYYILRKLDALGPNAFRDWLCQGIREAGGGESLDAYEFERNMASYPEAAE